MEEAEATEIKNVKIFVRILPTITMSESFMKIDDNKKDIYVRCLQDMNRNRIVKSKNPVYWRFPTDRIFYNTSQEEVYEVVTKDLLRNILDGANCVLISYGQTGTGKSFTTSGLRNSYEHRGLIPRLLSDMFEEKRNRKYTSKIEYRLSYVEIYQNQVNDLLVRTKDRPKFHIRDALKHVTSVSIKSEEETLKKIFEGEARKKIDQGATYDASHEGTSILTFHVSNISLIDSWAIEAHSKIHIVDMAGVDSAAKTNSRKSAERICNANLEKTQMEQLILDLQKSNRPKVHRHSSNLLKYLSAEFSLGSMLRFIAHISASNDDLVLTLSTLRFSSNVKKLKPRKIGYEIAPESSLQEIQKLRKDIDSLKQELDINDMLFNQEPLANISISRTKQIERDAIDFINGSCDDLMLLSVSQAQILLKTFKDMFAKLEADHKITLEQASRDAYDSAAKDLKGSTLSVTKTSKTAVTGSNGKMRRKKSAVEPLSKVISQPSVSEEETAKIKVGEIVDPGITIGPGQLLPAFGPVMKLMKLRKYGECQSRMIHVPCSDSSERVKVIGRDDAFERYLTEDEDAMRLKLELEEREAVKKAEQTVLTDYVTKYNEIKNELESKRVDLHKEQSIRHMMGNEVYDNEGRVLIIPESERRLVNVVMSLEKELGNMQCQVMKANEELRQLVENELDASYKLECAFQIFCENMYEQVVPKFDEDRSKEEVVHSLESLDVIEQMKSKFIDMQRMMKFMIQNKPVLKKEWRSHIGSP